jgi:MFS family permease
LSEISAGRKISWVPRAHPLSWATLAITTCAILMTAVDGGILPAVLPAIQEEYGLNNTQAGLINSVFFAALIVGALGFGWLSDRVGTGYRRTWIWNIAMLIGILGGALTFGLAGSSPSSRRVRAAPGSLPSRRRCAARTFAGPSC